MSKLIEKFKPPRIKPDDIEEGIRYLDENPEQKDFLGQVLQPGDLVVYGGSGDNSGNLRVGKVLGIYTKITPAKPNSHYRQTDRLETKVAVGLGSRWSRDLSRLSTTGDCMVKITEDAITDKELLKLIQDA